MKNKAENKEVNSHSCCSKKGISIGTVAGIVLGFFIGMLFDNTLNGMIIGFALGMGIGGVVDSRRKTKKNE